MPATLPDSCFCSDTGAMPFEKARSAVMALGRPLGRLDMVPLADDVFWLRRSKLLAPFRLSTRQRWTATP